MIHIERKKYLMDECVPIKVSNLQPWQHITIRCEVLERKFVFDSHAHFVASLNGTVDISCDPSFGGSYKGVIPMGIFSHMVAAKGQKKGLRYVPRNCVDPIEYKIQVYDGHLGDDSFLKSELLASRPCNGVSPIAEDVALRTCSSEGVTRHEVTHGRVRGTIFRPPGPGPFKGIIDIYGHGGGINESRVSLLASHGFIGFTLPHHHYADLVETMGQVEIEYFLEAIDYFTSLDDVQPNIGLIGICAGTSVSLFLSTICPKIQTVVAFSPCYYFYSPLTYQGKPFVTLDEKIKPDPARVITDHRGGVYSPFILAHTPVEEIAIKIEQSNAKFLFVVGNDDKSMNSLPNANFFADRMKKCGKEKNVCILSYPGVGHHIDSPYMPQTLLQYYPEFKLCAAVGGDVEENASASSHCWRELLSYLELNVGLTS